MIALNIDASDLRRAAADFNASQKDMRMAFSRALSRAATSLRTSARKESRQDLGPRAAAALRARLRLTRRRGRGNDLGGARLWIGPNDMAAVFLKGAPRQGPAGAIRGALTSPSAFVGRAPGSERKTTLRRQDRGRLPMQIGVAPIDDVATRIVNDVLKDAAERFFKSFIAEMRARTIYGAGR